MFIGAEEIAMAGALAGAGIAFGLLSRRYRAKVLELQEALGTDSLTGLLNRRGFEERMEIELERARRDGTPLAILVADLDDFKEINDRLGHLGGDMALERLSGVIGRTTRRADAAGRLGGEEFGFALPNTSALEALALANRLRAATSESFEPTATPGLTLSIGVARYPGHGLSVEELLHSADQAMYAAKAMGKDRTVLYESAPTAMLLAS
jgi:diguanylate cyclase (GGDEF)-like protein